MDNDELQQSVQKHQDRNAALREEFLEKRVDMRAPRAIDLHFWARGQASAFALAESLRGMGLQVPVQRCVGNESDPDLWNVEARITQSIDLTIRLEFITDLVRIADSHAAVFDGWGTLLER